MSETKTVRDIKLVVRMLDELFFYAVFDDGVEIQAHLCYPVLRLTTLYNVNLSYVKNIKRVILFGTPFRFIRHVVRYYTIPILKRKEKFIVQHDFYFLSERLSRPVREFYEKIINDITDRCDDIFKKMYCLRKPIDEIFNNS